MYDINFINNEILRIINCMILYLYFNDAGLVMTKYRFDKCTILYISILLTVSVSCAQEYTVTTNY